MKRRHRAVFVALLLVLLLAAVSPAAGAGPAADAAAPDLTERLTELYRARARWLLTDDNPPPLEADYGADWKAARWAIQHEQGKIRYMKQWAQNRQVRFVEAEPTITVKRLNVTSEKVRYYVAQSMKLGYVYPGEQTVNRFGVGTRHVIDLRRSGDKWLIAMEWYLDPLGDDTETPDVTPAVVPGPLPLPSATVPGAAPVRTAARGYDREGAVRYADQYCGLAWGCGNTNRYNPRFRDYSGQGGDCTNYVSQALRHGGNLSVPPILRVSHLAGHLQYSGRAKVVARAPFQELWKRASALPSGFRGMLKIGDLIAYQEKGKLDHFGIVTAFDTHGYPLINSHTADRYHVPFDLGWDRKTVYWFFQMRD